MVSKKVNMECVQKGRNARFADHRPAGPDPSCGSLFGIPAAVATAERGVAGWPVRASEMAAGSRTSDDHPKGTFESARCHSTSPLPASQPNGRSRARSPSSRLRANFVIHSDQNANDWPDSNSHAEGTLSVWLCRRRTRPTDRPTISGRSSC